MTKMVKAWLLTFLLAGVPFLAYAQNQNEALVRELYAKSGMEKQLEQVPLMIQAGFDQAALEDDHIRQLPGNLISTMKALAKDAFAARGLRETMLSELKEKLTVQDLKEVLRWLNSPMGKKCTRLEEAASTPETLSAMQQYAAGLQNSPPTAERLNVLRQLDSAVRATESSVEIAIGSQVAVASAIISTFPVEQQRPVADIARELEKERPQIEAAARMQTLLSLLYTYRSLTEAEVQEYIAFTTSPAGSKYHAVAIAAFKKALFVGSAKWGKAIGKAIEQAKNQSDA